MADARNILVLGVGNLLRRDEGFGVHVVQHLADHYVPSENVRLLDGGTAGLALLDWVLDSQHIIVVDVVTMGAPAGTVACLREEVVFGALKTKQSAHDWSLDEIILQAHMIGHCPEVVIVAAEPEDIATWSEELGPLLASKLPLAVDYVRAAVETWGGRLDPKAPAKAE